MWLESDEAEAALDVEEQERLSDLRDEVFRKHLGESATVELLITKPFGLRILGPPREKWIDL